MSRPRSHTSTIALTLLSTLVVVMAFYILFRYTATNKMPVTPSTGEQTAVPPVDPGRAFIRLAGAPAPIEKGGSLTLVFDSNEWSVCAVDIYKPDETSVILTKEASKPKQVAPGRFSWTWQVPADGVAGKWIARLLCGTADNLATVDQTFEVR
ncbi:MAG: hypothetical protein ABIO72_01600 [Patescibacteria group bacterium]